MDEDLIPDPSSGVRFNARGPFAVFNDQDFCHVADAPWKPNIFWRIANLLSYAISLAAELHIALAAVALIAIGLLVVTLYLLGIPLWLYERMGKRGKADRSGLTLGGRRWNWDEIRGVVADNVEWRETQPPGVAHAVILKMPGERLALLVDTFAKADTLATQLAFLRRTASGTPDDVPEQIRAARAAAEEVRPG